MRNQTRLLIQFSLVLLLASLLTACGKKPETGGVSTATVGQPAPSFVLNDTNGRTWNLADLKGKVVFVNFWATWCRPCTEELPAMETLHKTMAGRKFQMLAILNNDDPRMADNLAGRIGLTFPILTDPSSKVARSYGITGVPETYIVDADGILREKFIGGQPWDSQQAMDMLHRYMP